MCAIWNARESRLNASLTSWWTKALGWIMIIAMVSWINKDINWETLCDVVRLLLREIMLRSCLMRDINAITCNYRHYSLLFLSLSVAFLNRRTNADDIIYCILSHIASSVECLFAQKLHIGVEEHAPILNIIIKANNSNENDDASGNLWDEDGAHRDIKMQLISSLFKNYPLWRGAWDNKQQIAHKKSIK